MGAEFNAGLPASLAAIGIYTGIISIVGMACCSLVSIYERKLQPDPGQLTAVKKGDTRPKPPARRIELKRLREDFFNRN